MMKKLLLLGILVLVLGGGYYVMKGQKTVAPVENAMPVLGTTGVEEMVVEEESTGSSEKMMEKGVAKEFTVEASEFAFSLKTITVKKGDMVKITLTNSGKMSHDWVVDEFTGVKMKQIKNGETDTITFVADTSGTFEYYCSVGQHRKNGMVGKLIVE